MAFPKNNLPVDSLLWGREVERRVDNLETSLTSSQINNASRDAQLLSNFQRLDVAVADLVVTTTTANEAATNALTAAATAQTAADDAATAAQTALDAIDGLTGLGTAGSAYEINASNITAGTINASVVSVTNLSATNITTGTLTGRTVRTASSGRRAELGGTLASGLAFFDQAGNNSGTLSASNTDRSAELRLENSTGAGVFIYNGAADLVGPGTTISAGNSGNSTALIDSTRLDINGDVYNLDTYNNTTTAATNMYVSTGGLFMRTTTTSSREAKQNIELLDFDINAFLSVQPVTFKYKDGIITDPATKDQTQIGFIAEDFVDAGFEAELIKQPEGDEQYIGLRYDKMYMFLHKVVAEQQATIEALEARLSELENRV